MIDFRRGADWFERTSVETIFQRHALYSVYFGAFRNIEFGHDYLLNFVIALGGRFVKLGPDLTAVTEGLSLDSSEMKNLLTATNYARSPDWQEQMSIWASRHVPRRDVIHYRRLVDAIARKGDAVYDLLRQNSYAGFVLEDYFYELEAFGSHRNKRWPRV